MMRMQIDYLGIIKEMKIPSSTNPNKTFFFKFTFKVIFQTMSYEYAARIDQVPHLLISRLQGRQMFGTKISI